VEHHPAFMFRHNVCDGFSFEHFIFFLSIRIGVGIQGLGISEIAYQNSGLLGCK